MLCALRKLPVTDFMSDHNYAMSDRGSTSPQRRREESFPLRTTLPTREPSKEDIELAQRLLGHSQPSPKNNESSEQSLRRSQSPNKQRPGSSSPNLDRPRQITPRSEGEQSQAYAAVASQPDAVNSGQVCRLVLPSC